MPKYNHQISFVLFFCGVKSMNKKFWFLRLTVLAAGFRANQAQPSPTSGGKKFAVGCMNGADGKPLVSAVKN